MLVWLRKFLLCNHSWKIVGDRQSTINSFYLARCDKCGRKRFFQF